MDSQVWKCNNIKCIHLMSRVAELLVPNHRFDLITLNMIDDFNTVDDENSEIPINLTTELCEELDGSLRSEHVIF